MQLSNTQFRYALEEQRSDPQHVYVESLPGVFIRHSTDDEFAIPPKFRAKEKVRFTHLAAEAVVGRIPGARMVPV